MNLCRHCNGQLLAQRELGEGTSFKCLQCSRAYYPRQETRESPLFARRTSPAARKASAQLTPRGAPVQPPFAQPETASADLVTAASVQPLSLAFMGTCPPRQCGIATFAKDLEQALKMNDPAIRIDWAAIEEPGSNHGYGSEVPWRIRQGSPDSYRAAALEMNAAAVDVVSLQHEFGLYGVWGEAFDDHLGPFLNELRKPLVTTMHSVLPDPSSSVKASVARLGARSSQVVVMAEQARKLLVDTYGLPPHKVQVVPHGVPAVEPRGRADMKRQLGLSGRSVILTFGLVDPRKGLEYMIGAMDEVRHQHPEALYLIAGKTHPELLRREGEAYRERLQDLVQHWGLNQNVAFVDEYLTQAQIVEYLLASDVYVTPYLDPKQITSGTLAYALGAGKAIVSTAYPHATEVLAEGRGLLVDFRSSPQLAKASLSILRDAGFKHTLEQNAYAYGSETAWPRIGERMLSVYRAALTSPGGLTVSEAPHRAHAPTPRTVAAKRRSTSLARPAVLRPQAAAGAPRS